MCFFKRIQERLTGGPKAPPLSNLSHLGKPRLFTECLNTMTTNSSNKVIRGLFWGIQERLPLTFRKTKTLYNIFEHDDNQLNQQSYSRSSKRIQERLVGGLRPPFVQPLMFRKTKTLRIMFEDGDNQLNQQVIRGFSRGYKRGLSGAFGPPLSSLSCLGKPRPFTEYLNTMTTNSSNKVI